MMWTVRLVIGSAAASAFALAAAVHVSAIRGIDVEAQYPSVWWLHYAAMVLFVVSGVVAVRLTGPNPRFQQILSIIPWWALAAIGATLVYIVFCFLTLTQTTGAGAPMISEGRYFFNDHGTVREVSAAVFHAKRAASVRVFSAFWVYLTLIAAVVLLFARRKEEA